jgi:hypothetical protein
MIVLPRLARDKHRETTQKQRPLSYSVDGPMLPPLPAPQPPVRVENYCTCTAARALLLLLLLLLLLRVPGPTATAAASPTPTRFLKSCRTAFIQPHTHPTWARRRQQRVADLALSVLCPCPLSCVSCPLRLVSCVLSPVSCVLCLLCVLCVLCLLSFLCLLCLLSLVCFAQVSRGLALLRLRPRPPNAPPLPGQDALPPPHGGKPLRSSCRR